MAMNKGKSEAWMDGYDAYWCRTSGDSPYDCPYTSNKDVKEWKSGWKFAKQEDESEYV